MRGRLTRTVLVVVLGITGIAAASPVSARPAGSADGEPETGPAIEQINTAARLQPGTQPATDSAIHAEFTVRLTARLLADRRIEFGLQQRSAHGDWNERVLPARRYLPTTATELR